MKIYKFIVTLNDETTKVIEASSEQAVQVKLGWQNISENDVKSIEKDCEVASFVIK